MYAFPAPRTRAARVSSRSIAIATRVPGAGAPLDSAAVAALAPAGVELEYSWGGQPAYWWLIAAE